MASLLRMSRPAYAIRAPKNAFSQLMIAKDTRVVCLEGPATRPVINRPARGGESVGKTFTPPRRAGREP
jgi:hypothetical protein